MPLHSGAVLAGNVPLLLPRLHLCLQDPGDMRVHLHRHTACTRQEQAVDIFPLPVQFLMALFLSYKLTISTRLLVMRRKNCVCSVLGAHMAQAGDGVFGGLAEHHDEVGDAHGSCRRLCVAQPRLCGCHAQRSLAPCTPSSFIRNVNRKTGR